MSLQRELQTSVNFKIISSALTIVVLLRMANFTILGRLYSSDSSWDAFANFWILKPSASHCNKKVLLYVLGRSCAGRELWVWHLETWDPDLVPSLTHPLPGGFNLLSCSFLMIRTQRSGSLPDWVVLEI